MKHLFIHALSCTNLSGRQVLCGHLVEILKHADPSWRFTLALHDRNKDIVDWLTEEWGGVLPSSLRVVMAPSWTSHWLGRSGYERFWLPGMVRRQSVDVLWSLSGGWIRGLSCRQYTLALNPWCLIPTAIKGVGSMLKARLQRHAYRLAVRNADGIGYGSLFMQALYRANAGCVEKRGAVVYPALSDTEIKRMNLVKEAPMPRDPMTILCVSLMAPHKDIATLLHALKWLLSDHGCDARLRLIGGWADPEYRKEMDALIEELQLRSHVVMTGHVSREELRMAYRTARVYCLLSLSESFGIPAVEAQWMGTPVVGARGCAVPEVCGEGGWYVEPGDAREAARLLHVLLTDDLRWRELSAAAEKNARRFQYRHTSRPLLDMLGLTCKQDSP